MKRLILFSSPLIVIWLQLSAPAADFIVPSMIDGAGPLRGYRSIEDSPFQDFGFAGTLFFEDFEDGELNQKGVSLAPQPVLPGTDLHIGSQSIRTGYSVEGDANATSVGRALEADFGLCATTFPATCVSRITFDFDVEALGILPTFAGLVWTDAVRGAGEFTRLSAQVDVTNASGETFRTNMDVPNPDDQAFPDSVFLGTTDVAGIERLSITVLSDGNTSGHLAVDHLQFGVATIPGDANVDGAVDFSDFTVFASNFGNRQVTWREGDFTHDGRNAFPDLLKLSQHFGESAVIAPVNEGVPEPSGNWLAMLGVLVATLLRHRR